MVLALGQAMAAEVAGIKYDDSTKVAGKELRLNGAGVRTKVIVKVYTAGLYIPEKSGDAAAVQKMDGPRRVRLVMLRDVSSEDFGDAFMAGLRNNSSKDEQTKVLNQIQQFGQMFALLPGLKKGDVLHLDWVPGTGTVCELNGKKIGDTMQDMAFYNAVLRIWLGDKPVDGSLKKAMLGAG
jgi:hypothetical protein